MIRTNIMDKSSLDLMKQRAEELLEKKGLAIDHPELCDILVKKGCFIKDGRVCFSRALIQEAIANVPAEFTLYSPDGKHNLKFPHPHGGFYTRTNTGAPNYRTPEGDVRPYTLKDAEDWFTLANSLPNINFVALPSVDASDEVPANAVDLCSLNVALRTSKKHIWIQPYTSESVKGLIKMVTAAAGGEKKLREEPIVSFIACSVPLLSYKHMDAEILLECARAGIPVQPCSLPTAGANTPITAQGTALVCCAEVLAMIVILQLLSPGLPVVATPLPFSMDMITTYILQSAPEITLCRMMCMQFFEEGYGIRAHTYASGTDSLTTDGQSMIERTSLAQALAFSGASILGGGGQIETAKTNCPLSLITDNEIFGIMQRLRMGLTVDDEVMGIDELLNNSGEQPDSFLMTKHTLRHCREITRPEFFNRNGMNTWEKLGYPTFEDKIRSKYDDIMNSPVRHQLSKENEDALNKAFDNAMAEVAK